MASYQFVWDMAMNFTKLYYGVLYYTILYFTAITVCNDTNISICKYENIYFFDTTMSSGKCQFEFKLYQ